MVDIFLLWLSAGHGHSDPGEAGVWIHQQSPAADHDAKPGEVLSGSALSLCSIECPVVRVKKRKQVT